MTYDNLYCVWLTTEMRAETCGKYRYVAEAAEAACCCMDLAAIAEKACDKKGGEE